MCSDPFVYERQFSMMMSVVHVHGRRCNNVWAMPFSSAGQDLKVARGMLEGMCFVSAFWPQVELTHMGNNCLAHI